jgi:hypothetical protein
MNAKSSSNTMPLVQVNKRERAGEHILFNARIRSKLAKQGSDALSDLAHRDVDHSGRYPAPAEIGTGGELVPAEPDLRDTVKNPDYVTVDASRDRLALASGAGVLEMALDASDTIDSKNSLEKIQRSGARVVGGDTEAGRGDRGMANEPHALSLFSQQQAA